MEIIFENVSYAYDNDLPISNKVLKDISLIIKKKEVNAIIGPSGSGKTTCIELITALMIPTEGNINVGDINININTKINNINKLRSKIGFVFQFPEQQFFNSTVYKEVEFAMKHFNYKINEIDNRVKQAIKMVGLDETYLDKSPFDLSNGEKRKVAIASMLVYNPKLIILDEPTVGLDNKSKNMLIRLIRNLKFKYNKTIIIVSHDVDMVYKCCDNVIVLKDGNILLDGNKFDILKKVDFLRKNNINIPKVVEFSDIVYKQRGIDLGNYTEIKDLIKAIYRNV